MVFFYQRKTTPLLPRRITASVPEPRARLGWPSSPFFSSFLLFCFFPFPFFGLLLQIPASTSGKANWAFRYLNWVLLCLEEEVEVQVWTSDSEARFAEQLLCPVRSQTSQYTREISTRAIKRYMGFPRAGELM